MPFIYLITSPSGKQYVGQSKITVEAKINTYRLIQKGKGTTRKIINAIRKYGWDQMSFEVIDKNQNWTTYELDNKEIYWIRRYNSTVTGYNMTPGGKGTGTDTSRKTTLAYHKNMTEEQKKIRAQNCSKGQLKRFEDHPESEKTKKRKRDAHNGSYRIESPDGKVWETDIGLKGFAEQYQTELKISYWGLFNAYRKCYNKQDSIVIRKNTNNWKVTRIDKSDSRNLLETRSKD